MTRRAIILSSLGLSAAIVTAAGATVAVRSSTSASQALTTASNGAQEHAGPDSTRVATLLQSLRTADPLVCELLVDQLGNYWSDNSAVGRFEDARRALDAARDSIRSRITSAGAINLLLHSLDAEDPCVRRVAAKWLGRSRVDGARLVTLLDSPSLRIRTAAAYAIGSGNETHGALARRPLEKMLRDGGATDGAMAAWALGEIEDSASTPELTRALRSPHETVRLAAVDALGSMESAPALKEIERLLREDRSEPVRIAAARAIGDIGDVSSVSALEVGMRDASMKVRYEAVEAIGNLHDLERAPAALVAAVQSTDSKLQHLAALALADLHDPQTLDALLTLVSHRDRAVRLKVAEALGEIGSSKASNALMQLLKDADPEVRRAAAEALGEIRQ